MIKLNLGSGVHTKTGWINLDIENHPGVTYCDLSLGKLPFGNDSVDFVYSEHFLEHLTQSQGLVLLKEVYRVLKPKGILRLSIPDLRHLVYHYMYTSGEDGRPVDIINIPGIWEPKTRCQMLNEGMRLWAHQYMYDYTELRNTLLEVKFKYVMPVQHNQSPHPELRNMEVRPYMNEIQVEAIK